MTDNCEHPPLNIEYDNPEFLDDSTVIIKGQCELCGLKFQEVYYLQYYEELSNMDNASNRLSDIERTDLDPQRTCRNCSHCVGHVAKIPGIIALCIEGGSADELSDIDEPLNEYQCNAWKKRR